MSGQSKLTPTCHVYVIGQPGSSLVKIGRTSSDLHHRLAAIQGMSPVPLELRGGWHVDNGAERRLHIEFAARRRHGEWFEFGDVDPVVAVTELLQTDPRPLAEVAPREKPWRPTRGSAGVAQRGRPVVAARTQVDELVRLREARGWSATELARQSGVKPYCIYKAERGTINFSLDTLMRVSRALSCSPWELTDFPDLVDNPLRCHDGTVTRSMEELRRRHA